MAATERLILHAHIVASQETSASRAADLRVPLLEVRVADAVFLLDRLARVALRDGIPGLAPAHRPRLRRRRVGDGAGRGRPRHADAHVVAGLQAAAVAIERRVPRVELVERERPLVLVVHDVPAAVAADDLVEGRARGDEAGLRRARLTVGGCGGGGGGLLG